MNDKYKSILVITKLVPNSDGDSCVLDIPFKSYGTDIVMNGKDITYRLHEKNLPGRLKYKGKEVLAKVDYRSAEYPGNLDVLVETETAKKFIGNIGNDWSKIRKDLRYKKHYNRTLAETRATYDRNGVKTLYNGTDKNELDKFTQWRDEAAESKNNIGRN